MSATTTTTTSSFLPKPADLVHRMMDLSEFFTIQPIQYANQSQLMLLKAKLEYTGDNINTGGGGGRGSTVDKRFAPASEHHILATSMFNGESSASPGGSTSTTSHYHYTTTVVRSLSDEAQLYTVSGLPPMVLPSVFDHMLLYGKQETTRPNVQFNVHYYELRLSADQEEAFDKEDVGLHWITYHQLKLIARRVYCFKKSDFNATPVYNESLLRAFAKFVLQHHEQTQAYFNGSGDAASFPEADFSSDRDDLFQSPLELANVRISVMSVLEFMHTQAVTEDDRNAFYRSPFTKMLLHRREWNLLSRYYPAEIIGPGMSIDAFQNLFRLITTAPVDLCFEYRAQYVHNVVYDLMVETEEEELYLRRPLPELSSSALVDLLSQDDKVPIAVESLTVYNMALVCVYQALKDGWNKDKHTFMHLRELRTSAIKYVQEHKEITSADVYGIVSAGVGDKWWSDLLSSLVEDHAAVVQAEHSPPNKNGFAMPIKINTDRVVHTGETRVYLYGNWADEEIIAQSLGHVSKTAARLSNVLKQPLPKLEDLRTNAGHPLCNEQMAALNNIYNNGVTVVTGPGGSGKSDLLQTINDIVHIDKAQERKLYIGLNKILFPHKSLELITKEADKVIEDSKASLTVLGTSAQGNNVSDLSRLLGSGSTSFTMHRLFLKHHRCCPNYGFKNMSKQLGSTSLGSADAPRDPCIFEGIKLLVVEEGSLASPESLAKLLGLLVMCAKELQRVLIVGDSNQCASVSGGKVMADLTKALALLKQTTFFTHDHRSNPESRLLKQNADAILAQSFAMMKFDDKVAIHEDIQVKPRVWNPNKGGGGNDWASMTPVEMKTLALHLIRQHKLSIYNSHMITRTNFCREKLDLALRQFYFEQLHRGLTFRPYVFFRGAKVVFNRGAVGGGRNEVNVPRNKPCIIVDIIELNTHELENRHSAGSVSPFLQTASKKRKTDTVVVEGQKRIKTEDGGTEVVETTTSSTTTTSSSTGKEEKQFVQGPKNVAQLATVQDEVKAARMQYHCARYLVVYELSSFSSVIMNDERYVLYPHLSSANLDFVEQRIEHERQRFFNEIRNGTANNVQRIPRPSGPPDYMLIDTERVFSICPWRFDTHNFLSWGFVTTVHKFQGLQTDNIVYWLLTDSRFETVEIMYTALTRCRRKEILVGATPHIQKCLKQREPARNTSLAEKLVQCIHVRK